MRSYHSAHDHKLFIANMWKHLLMSLIISKTVVQLLFLILIVAVYGIMMYLAKKGKTWKVRRIPGIDAIEESIGRATELNRPVAFFPGEGKLHDARSGDTVAAVVILGWVTKLAARLGAPIYVHTTLEESVPLLQDVCQNAYTLEGKEDKYDPVYTVRFTGAGNAGYLYGATLFQTEKIAVNLMFGDLGLESLTMAEEGNRVGAVGIAGSTRISNVCFLAAAMDYTILSDELFAAAAYITYDPVEISVVTTSDIIKMAALILGLVGPVLYAVGINLDKIFYPS